jgi:ketosteroid isomerase-like protein
VTSEQRERRAVARKVPPGVLERLRVEERFDCFNRGEFELMLELYADDAVFDVGAVFTDVEPVRGREDMLRSWRELRETWGGGMRSDPIELFELADGRFVLDLRLHGKGTRSGVEVDQRFAFLYTIREDGKITHARLFADVQRAIDAAAMPAT